ncbi:MAG: hypothetical protein WCI03_04015 [bacterium]
MNKLLSSGLILLAVAATSDCVWAGSATPESIMVVPARKRMVQLAFEISRCKEIGLVTYNNSPSLPAPLLHAWNGQEWIQISMDDYVEGRFMSGDPKHVFLLGDASSLPLKMMDGPTWYKDLNRITTLDIATIINQVGNVLHFSTYQWKWLAETYGMKIEDKNTELRRYGRWGAPGKEKDLAPNKLESVVLPPNPPIADPIMIKAEEPKAKIEPVNCEMPLPPKVDVPVGEKPAVPVTVTITPAPAKVEAPKAEAPVVAAPVAPEPPKVAPSAPVATPAVK